MLYPSPCHRLIITSETMARLGLLSQGRDGAPMLLRAELTTPSSLRSRRQISAFPAIGVTTGMKNMMRRMRENLVGRCCNQ